MGRIRARERIAKWLFWRLAASSWLFSQILPTVLHCARECHANQKMVFRSGINCLAIECCSCPELSRECPTQGGTRRVLGSGETPIRSIRQLVRSHSQKTQGLDGTRWHYLGDNGDPSGYSDLDKADFSRPAGAGFPQYPVG